MIGLLGSAFKVYSFCSNIVFGMDLCIALCREMRRQSKANLERLERRKNENRQE